MKKIAAYISILFIFCTVQSIAQQTKAVKVSEGMVQGTYEEGRSPEGETWVKQ
jgi:hypothetical protein